MIITELALLTESCDHELLPCLMAYEKPTRSLNQVDKAGKSLFAAAVDSGIGGQHIAIR